MWDLSLLGIVPGMRVAAPRDAATLREELAEAVAVDDGPTAIRFPKGAVIDAVPAVRRVDGVDVLHEGGGAEVLLVCAGAFGQLGVATAARLERQGVSVTVVDPRWVLPVPEAVVAMAREHRLVVALADGGRHGGFGSALADALRDGGVRRARARPGDTPGVPRPRQPGRRAGRRRAGGAGRRPADHGVGGGAAPGAHPARPF